MSLPADHGTGDEESADGPELDPGEEREPLAASLPHGLRAALADVDKLFELVRRGADPPASTDELHAWLRQQLVNEYASGEVPARRTRRALPRLDARRRGPDPRKPRR